MPTRFMDRITVATIDELRALGPRDLYAEGQLICVTDEKRGGLFRYESSLSEFDEVHGVRFGAANPNVPGGFRRQFDGPVKPEWWGAEGDGSTNDTEAFHAMSRYVERVGGIDIELAHGCTYIVGKQTFAGAFGNGYSYRPSPIIQVQYCDNPFAIYGKGATLRHGNGLRIGAFHPETGSVYNSTARFTDLDYKASPGHIINVSHNASVVVQNIELDGNMANMIEGGEWGTAPKYQCASSGIVAYGTDNLEVRNVYSHHQGQDGIMIGYENLAEGDPEHPVTLTNVRAECNNRQGLTWVGGNSLTAINCAFSYTGRGAFASAPASGVDIEAEDSICRDALFIKCDFFNNAGGGLLADVGDVEGIKCVNCTFWSGGRKRGGYAVWPRKPRIHFVGCEIYGPIASTYDAENNEEGTKFHDCRIEDKPHPDFDMWGGTSYLISLGGGAANTEFRRCTVVAHSRKLIYITTDKGRGSFARIIDCEFVLADDTIPGRSVVAVIGGTYLSHVTFRDELTSPPPDGYYINVTNFGEVIVGEEVRALGPYTKWEHWERGFTGTYPPGLHNQKRDNQ